MKIFEKIEPQKEVIIPSEKPEGKKIIPTKVRLQNIEKDIEELGIIGMDITLTPGKEDFEDSLIAVESVIEIIKEQREDITKRAMEKQKLYEK